MRQQAEADRDAKVLSQLFNPEVAVIASTGEVITAIMVYVPDTDRRDAGAGR